MFFGRLKCSNNITFLNGKDVKQLYKTGERNKIHGNYFNIDPQFFLFKYFCIVNYSSSLER